MTVHINAAALAAVALSPEAQQAYVEAGEAVAANVRQQGTLIEGIPGDIAVPVEVSASPKGASVTITHAAGLAVQAKHGALTKAAAQAGLDVTAS